MKETHHANHAKDHAVLVVRRPGRRSSQVLRLLAQYHHNLTRPDAFVVHHHVRNCVACFLSTEAPRWAWVASSYPRSRRASKPRTAPASSVAATCTAPSRKSEPCGW